MKAHVMEQSNRALVSRVSTTGHHTFIHETMQTTHRPAIFGIQHWLPTLLVIFWVKVEASQKIWVWSMIDVVWWETVVCSLISFPVRQNILGSDWHQLLDLVSDTCWILFHHASSLTQTFIEVMLMWYASHICLVGYNSDIILVATRILPQSFLGGSWWMRSSGRVLQ